MRSITMHNNSDLHRHHGNEGFAYFIRPIALHKILHQVLILRGKNCYPTEPVISYQIYRYYLVVGNGFSPHAVGFH